MSLETKGQYKEALNVYVELLKIANKGEAKVLRSNIAKLIKNYPYIVQLAYSGGIRPPIPTQSGPPVPEQTGPVIPLETGPLIPLESGPLFLTIGIGGPLCSGILSDAG
jgi:hypothetical protein